MCGQLLLQFTFNVTGVINLYARYGLPKKKQFYHVFVTNVAAYVALMLLNVVGALSYFIASMQHSVSNQSGTTFGVSILLLILFVPCSFVCWFRPVYNAFQ